MFAQVHTPEILTGLALDGYLERGWFRMGQTIFTTNFHRVGNEIYSTIWLRILLNEYSDDIARDKLFKRNSTFRAVVGPIDLTDEKEALFVKYRDSVHFQASASLHHLLFSVTEPRSSIYRTHEVAVYDGSTLIACGFFDIGEKSAEGITSFYDPAYRKFSLGKYLIYLKVQHCKQLRLDFFYPGYFVPGNASFDYKLSIATSALEFLQLSSGVWKRIAAFSEESIPFQVMRGKLLDMQALLHVANVQSRLFKYEFFDVNLIPQLRDNGLFEFPIFLFFGNEAEENTEPIIVFDMRDDQYHLLMCTPVWKAGEISKNPDFYSDYLLNANYEIHASTDKKELASIVVNILKI